MNTKNRTATLVRKPISVISSALNPSQPGETVRRKSEQQTKKLGAILGDRDDAKFPCNNDTNAEGCVEIAKKNNLDRFRKILEAIQGEPRSKQETSLPAGFSSWKEWTYGDLLPDGVQCRSRWFFGSDSGELIQDETNATVVAAGFRKR